MLSNSSDSIPIIFLITDGSVEDERHICDVMKSQLTNQQKVCPRIYTLGIGKIFSITDVYVACKKYIEEKNRTYMIRRMKAKILIDFSKLHTFISRSRNRL